MSALSESVAELSNGVKFWVRDGTNDFSTVNACSAEDEYDLAGVDVQGKLVFDVGAHIGGVGITLATRGARVVCIEPVPDNAELIRRSAELNGVHDLVTVFEVTAGSPGEQVVRWGFRADPEWNDRVAAEPGLGLLHDDGRRTCIEHHRFVGTTTVDFPEDQVFNERTVPSVVLSEVIERYGSPYLVKLDCEGGEWAWLMDQRARFVELIVGEWHPWDCDFAVTPSARPPDLGKCRPTIVELLGETHDLEFSGFEGGPSGFRAARKT